MEHVSLSAIPKGSKELAISRARLDNTIIHTNQERYSIDRLGHDDREISFGSRKRCNKTSIDFRWNTNDGICMNLPITIGSISSHITRLKSGTEMQIIGFGQYHSSDG